jgi:hypothetical protein
MRTHADDGKIFKITSDIVVCCPKFGMALACPLPIAHMHIEEHCQGIGATPGMPMSTPFILSSSSKDLELKGISTVRIPDYEGGDDSDSGTGSAITKSDHEGEGPNRSSSPSGDGTLGGGENAGDEASGGLGVASAGGGTKSSHINFGGGSAAAKKANKDSSERRKSRKGRKPPRTGANNGKPLFGELTMAPLAQVFKDGGSKPPTAADVALVFTPVRPPTLVGGSSRARG